MKEIYIALIRSDYTLQALLQNDLFQWIMEFSSLELDPQLIENYKLHLAYYFTMCHV